MYSKCTLTIKPMKCNVFKNRRAYGKQPKAEQC